MAEWTRIDKSTIEEHLRGEEINILQNQKILALMQLNKRISYNHSGKSMTWRVRKSRNTMQSYGDAQEISYPRKNRHEKAELEWGGYIVSESVSEKERQMNKGKEAIVNFVADLTEAMIDDIKYAFHQKFYVDGNATGNEDDIQGFPSWQGVTGNNQYTAPSDDYAGLSTILGNYGGSVISGSWPTGKFDPQYYFWSPLIVNYTHAGWSAGTDTWAENAVEALSAGITHQKNQKGKQGNLDLIQMTAAMFEEFKADARTKERITLYRDGESSGLVKLGFSDVINFDGIDISFDVDVPDTQANGLNFKEMELCSLQKQLFMPHKGYEMRTLSDEYALLFFGQLKGNPRANVLWDDIT